MKLKYVAIVSTLLLLVAVGFLLLPGEKEKEERVVKVGVIALSKVDEVTFNGFKEGMKNFGWEEGKTIEYINEGPAGSIDKLDVKVSSVLSKAVDIIFVSSTPGTLAVKKATKHTKTPVVFAPVNDPLGSGVVSSLKNPRGHITGIKLPSSDRQRFQWIYKISPNEKKVLIPYTPGDKSSQFSRLQAKEAADALGIDIIERRITNKKELENLVENFPKGVNWIFWPRDSTLESYIEDIFKFTYKNGIIINAPSYQQVDRGAQIAYGFIHYDIGKQAASLADKILKGTKPADLPVEVAKSYLVINTDATKRVGLKIPDEILVQAHKLIKK